MLSACPIAAATGYEARMTVVGLLRALASACGAIGGALATGPLLGIAVLALVALVWWIIAGPTREPVKRLSMVIRAYQSGNPRPIRRRRPPRGH